MHATVVEATDMRTGHAEINATDLHIGHLLGLDDGVARTFLGKGRVHDLALAHAARGDWPRPTMFSEPSAFCSPTTAQIFDVPISRPTMMFVSSNIFPPEMSWAGFFGHGCRHATGRHPPHGYVVGYCKVRRGDRPVHALTQVINFPPARQLLLQISGSESISARCPVVATTTPVLETSTLCNSTNPNIGEWSNAPMSASAACACGESMRFPGCNS